MRQGTRATRIVFLATVFTIWLSYCVGATEKRCGSDLSHPTSNGESGKEILGKGLGKFIMIPGGAFTMGSDHGENKDERPQHLVKLSPFFIGRTPVTNREFVEFLKEAKLDPKDYLASQVSWVSGIDLVGQQWNCAEGAEDWAASVGSWALAVDYCEWLSKKSGRRCRLPTEAEWEYVCRGREGRKFPWGDDLKGLDKKIWGWRGWTPSNPKCTAVGSFPEGATPEGVCDLIGYMDEVCSDWYQPGYYANSPENDPKGPDQPRPPYDDTKVVRGGLERPYVGGSFVTKLFRDSQYFGILPTTYLPRGWSRGKAILPREARFVYGRLGMRVVVECRRTK